MKIDEPEPKQPSVEQPENPIDSNHKEIAKHVPLRRFNRTVLVSLLVLASAVAFSTLNEDFMILLRIRHRLPPAAKSVQMSKEIVDLHIVNLVPEPILVMWMNYEGIEIPWLELGIWKESFISSYPGNVWRFYNNLTREWLFDETAPVGPNGCSTIHILRNSVHRRELFEYCERENGRSWINVYPRKPPQVALLPSSKVGEVKKIATNQVHPNSSGKLLELEIKTVSIEPKAFLIDGFLSDFECDYIISAANKTFERSTVVGTGVSNVRTSSTSWLEVQTDPVLDRVARRIFDVLGIDYRLFPTVAEKLQVLRYEIGQEYQGHWDYFELYSRNDGQNNRLATSFMYLTGGEGTDLEGGETVFPTAGRSPASSDPCSNDFRISPKRGRLLIFYSMLESGNLDKFSKHLACPVRKGVKYASNFWIWDTRFT